MTDPQLDWLFAQFELDAPPQAVDRRFEDKVSTLFEGETWAT
jgi:hypothetical protein